MANNRMWLVHPRTGARVRVAKYYPEYWTVRDDLERELQAAMTAADETFRGNVNDGDEGWVLVFSGDGSLPHEREMEPCRYG